jgi:hypothetical protein
MEGLLFYWISWSLWIYLTFILRKNHPLRWRMSAMMLMLIILTSVHFSIGHFELFGSGLFILFIVYMSVSNEKKGLTFYFLISSLIISIAYSTFHLFEIFDPVWLFFDRGWMLGLIMGGLTLSLQKSFKWRFFTLLAGGMQGEILTAFLLERYSIIDPIGALDFLDVSAIASVFLILWSAFEHVSAIYENHFTFAEKENQKTS